MPAETNATLLSMLFDEANHRDRSAREALFLTFNSDLGFFESQVLGSVRSTGAAVTVIADANVYDPDPRAIHAAGMAYATGLAVSPSVFHPKLSVVAGPSRAAVGIGSGNLTMSGWHLNDEVLTIITGDADNGCPPILQQVADWLDQLLTTGIVTVGPTARAGISRTVEQLRKLCASAPTISHDLRLIGNLQQSIVSQLPRTPVDELRLFAPFHDLAGQALDELITTLNPATIRIAVQERATVIDPHALLAVADRKQVQLTFERAADGSDSSYRHGKVIEARSSGMTAWTLSGSPNLSVQALCRAAAAGGNCELAVLDHSGRELYPPTTAEIPSIELEAHRSGPPAAEEEPDPQLARDGLLEARFDGDHITLSFAHPIATLMRVELSPYATDPDHFTTVADLEPGRAEYSIDADPTWSYPLRLRTVSGDTPGPIYFVMRPDQVVIRTRGAGGARVPDYDPDQIFTDARQATEWLAAITELALSSQTATRSQFTAARGNDSQSGGGAHKLRWDDPVTWHTYVEDATHRLGGPMVDYALGGLPRLAFVPAGGRADWQDAFAKRAEEGGEEAQTQPPDDGLTDDMDDSVVPARDVNSNERARYRRWLADLISPMDKLEAIDRAARARLMLRATRMAIWEPGIDCPWFELLLQAARALPGDDIPPQQQPTMHALAQVIVHELATAAATIGVSRSVDGSQAMTAYLETEGVLRELLDPVDLSLLDTFAGTIHVKGRVPPDPDLIAQHAAGALDDDPVRQPLRRLMLTYPDLSARSDGDRVISVQTSERSPLMAAGQCLDSIAGDWAVFATADSGRRAVVARVGETMLTAELGQRPHPDGVSDHVRFLVFRLSALQTPIRITAREGLVRDGAIRAIETSPLDAVGVKGAQLLGALRIDAARVRTFVKST